MNTATKVHLLKNDEQNESLAIHTPTNMMYATFCSPNYELKTALMISHCRSQSMQIVCLSMHGRRQVFNFIHEAG